VTVRLVELDRAGLIAHRDEVLDVYAEAMEVRSETARARRSVLASHLDRDGLRAVAAFVDHAAAAPRDADDPRDPDDQRGPGEIGDPGRMVGIAYGYLGAPGQWWHDQVRAAIGEPDGGRWLDDSFEVCELHVRPALQGTGLGRRLLTALLAGTPARTAVLTTPDLETRARGFYRRAGWVDLVRDLRFPGDPRSFAVLGIDLPH
jgi:ribosomal protein S18 acetylase RimI-like enzyme